MGLTETVCATVEDPKIGGEMGHVGGRVPGAPKGACDVAAVPQPTGVATNHGCPQEPLGGPPTVWHGLKMDTGRTPLFREDRKLAGVAHFCFAGPDRGFALSLIHI